MKIKLVAATFFAMGVVSTSVSANGEVKFIGSVVTDTCNLVPEVGGSISNTLQLGQAKVGQTTVANGAGAVVPFALKAKSGDAGCAALVGGSAGAVDAIIAWTGNFDSVGLKTSLDKTHVLIKTVNSTDVTKDITDANQITTFDAKDIGSGLNLTAQLVSGSGATALGNVSVATAYTVTYL